jgi:hypothetical protein
MPDQGTPKTSQPKSLKETVVDKLVTEIRKDSKLYDLTLSDGRTIPRPLKKTVLHETTVEDVIAHQYSNDALEAVKKVIARRPLIIPTDNNKNYLIHPSMLFLNKGNIEDSTIQEAFVKTKEGSFDLEAFKVLRILDSPYARELKLTIDHNKINEDLAKYNITSAPAKIILRSIDVLKLIQNSDKASELKYAGDMLFGNDKRKMIYAAILTEHRNMLREVAEDSNYLNDLQKKINPNAEAKPISGFIGDKSPQEVADDIDKGLTKEFPLELRALNIAYSVEQSTGMERGR